MNELLNHPFKSTKILAITYVCIKDLNKMEKDSLHNIIKKKRIEKIEHIDK
jgi:hypothetical protein